MGSKQFLLPKKSGVLTRSVAQKHRDSVIGP